MKRYRDIVKVLFRVWAYICPSPCVAPLCVCVYGEWHSRLQTADPFHHGWTLTTSRCPKCDDQTKYFGFDKKSRGVCFDSVALRRRKTSPTDERSVSNSFAHTLHAIVPQCHSASPGIPLIFLGIPPFSTPHHNFGSFLLFSFGLTSVDPCDLPLRAPSGLLTTIRPALPTLYDPFTVCYI